MSNAVELTQDSFKDTVASGVTLVDFWAEWCGPCRMITPVLDQLSAEYDGKVCIAKVNVDHAPALAEDYGVQSIPTLLVMKDGAEVTRFIGVTSKGDLAAALDNAIG